MAPRYGRGYKKDRVHYTVPFNRGNRLTLVSAISIYKVEAALYGEWSANGEIFLHFIEEFLCPVLRPEQVVVMDNVGFIALLGLKRLLRKEEHVFNLFAALFTRFKSNRTNVE